MQVTEVLAGYFRLDGGAMFGIVPKSMWQKLNPADENNLCLWSMRSLLIQTGDRKILVDCGIGDKQSSKFRQHFCPAPPSVVTSLADIAIQPEEITDVFLTHFHFDHVGGALRYDEHDSIVPTFPQASYWTNEVHYNWSLKGNVREDASFLHENFVPLREQGLLRYIDVQQDDVEWMAGVRVRFLYGHTEAMMSLIIDRGEGEALIYYPSDLIPSRWHVRLPYILSYDLRPLHTLEEKERMLDECIASGGQMIFEHDPSLAAVRIGKDDRGRYAYTPWV